MSAILLTHCTTLEVGGKTFLNGFVAPESLGSLQLDDYQRALLPYAGNEAWEDAYTSLLVPPIQLGMRGADIAEVGQHCYELRNSTFIIDGQQRHHAASKLYADGVMPIVGAIVETRTTWYTECERFIRLNSSTRPVTGSALLRASKHKYPLLEELYNLVDESTGQFVLAGRVAWDTIRQPTDLISGMTLAKVALYLHSRYIKNPSSNAGEIAETFDALDQMSISSEVTNNVHRFFELVHKCWDIGSLERRDRHRSTVAKATFLHGLARLFGEHENFWKGEKLVVPAELEKRLGRLSLNTSEIVLLCKGSTTGGLVTHLTLHMNSRVAEANRMRPFALQ